MAQYASIKRRPKAEAKPSPGTLAHNQRLANNIDLLPKEHRLPNYHLNKLSNVTKVFNNWKTINEERYQDINGRKLRSDAHRLESLAIILSQEQVNKCNPNDIWENAQKFKEWFETRYKTTVRTMDWHRDEGHIDEEGNVIRNEHIHLEFDNVNFDGKMVRKLFSKGDLVGFQDKIAEIYKPLGFVRGEDTAKKSRGDKPKLGIPQREWKKTKTIEAKAKKEPLAKLKDVQAINLQLRAELAAIKAKREDYAALEEEIKLLKKQAKAKALSEAALTKKNIELSEQIKEKDTYIEEAENLILQQVDTIDDLRTKVKEIEQKEPEKIEVEKIVYKEDNTRINELETKISKQEQTISNKESEISTLTKQNEALNKKIATLPHSDTLEELKTLKNDFEKLNSEYWELDALAYNENHVIQEADAYGMFHDRVPSYKELYGQSLQKIAIFESKIGKQEEKISALDDGYSKIEENIFGKDENRSVDEIVKGVSDVVNVLSNISKYFKLGMEKMMSMFIDRVPKKEEVEKDDSPKIKSLLSSDKEKSSSPGMKRMKP